MVRSLMLSLVVSPFLASLAEAQSIASGDSGPRPLLPRQEEIALARSAAPAAVSAGATIYVLTARGYEGAVEGTNGAACYVARDWKISLEPHCFDREGAETIMRMDMRRGELLHEGVGLEEANRIIAAGLLHGEFRLPSRLAMSWMMSSAQQLVNAQGEPVGAWKPHVMIYYPFLTAEDVGLADDAAGATSTMMANGGSPRANVVVVVPDFVDPVASAPADRGGR